MLKAEIKKEIKKTKKEKNQALRASIPYNAVLPVKLHHFRYIPIRLQYPTEHTGHLIRFGFPVFSCPQATGKLVPVFLGHMVSGFPYKAKPGTQNTKLFLYMGSKRTKRTFISLYFFPVEYDSYYSIKTHLNASKHKLLRWTATAKAKCSGFPGMP